MTLRSLACAWLVALFAMSGGEVAQAQVPATLMVSDTVWQVQLADGSTIYGRVVDVDGDDLTIVSQAGVTIEVGRGQIRSMSPIRGTIRDGTIWPEDPNTTRLFFGPTGRMMRGGRGVRRGFRALPPFRLVLLHRLADARRGHSPRTGSDRRDRLPRAESGCLPASGPRGECGRAGFLQ